VGSPGNPLNYSNYEYVIVFSLGDENLEPPGPDTPTGLTSDLYHQWSVGCWFIAPVSTNKGDHPCPFPESLAERVIRLYSWPGDLVLDPWLGTGTTTAVAARLQRRWFGIDIIDKYARLARARTIESHRKWQELAKEIREQGGEPRNPVQEALGYSCEEDNIAGNGPDISDEWREDDHA
jgi:DNA modification methylase